MKKFSFLCLAIVGLLYANICRGQDACTPVSTFPWIENFDSYLSGGDVSIDCWVNQKIDSAGNTAKKFAFVSSSGQSSTPGISLPDARKGCKAFLVLPPMAINEADRYEFSFDINRNASGSSSLGEGIFVCTSLSSVTSAEHLPNCDTIAFVSRNKDNTSMFSAYATQTETTTGWYKYSFTLPQGENVYIVLIGRNEYGNATYLDNFKVRRISSCAKMEQEVTISNITANSASLAFSDVVFAKYQIVLSTQDLTSTINDMYDKDLVVNSNGVVFNNDNTADIAGVVNQTLNNLTPNTNYYVYIRHNCSDSEKSDWTYGGSFKTAIGLPYTNSFTTYTEWTQRKADVALVLAGELNDWTSDTRWGITTATNDVFGRAHSYCLMRWASNLWLISPTIDMTTDESAAVLSLDLAYNTSNTGGSIPSSTDNNDRILLLISDDNGVSWTKANTWVCAYNTTLEAQRAYVNDNSHIISLEEIANTGYTGYHIRLDASAYRNNFVKVALATVSDESTNYVHIKDFSIKASASACLGVKSLSLTPESTSVQVNVNAYPADAYEYSYGTSESDMSTYSHVTTSSFEITGLTPNTDYVLKVRTVCGETPSDDYTINFTTLCGTETIDKNAPFVEEFEDAASALDCWHLITATASSTTYPRISSSHLEMANTSSSMNNTTFAILPLFDKNIQDLTLSFDCRAASGSSSSYLDSLHIGVMTDPTDANTFTLIKKIETSYTTSSTFSNIEIPFAEYTGEGKYLAIKRVPKGSSSRGAIIDNLKVSYASCKKLYDITVENITTTSAKVKGTATETYHKIQLLVATSPLDVSSMTENKQYSPEDNAAIVLTWSVIGDANWSDDIDGLSSNTQYYVYARKYCSSHEFSEWSNEVTFKTAIGLPYENAFSASDAIADWTQYKADVANVLAGNSVLPTPVSNSWKIETGQYGIFNNANRLYIDIYNSTTNTWLVTPTIDMTTTEPNAILSFNLAYTGYNNANRPAETSNQRLLLLISTERGSSWSKANTWVWSTQEYANESAYVDAESHYASLWDVADGEASGTKIEIDASAYIGQSIKIAFCVVSNNGDYGLRFKDFSLKGASSFCPRVNSLSVNAQATTAQVTLNTKHTGDFEYTYGPTDGTMSELRPTSEKTINLTNLIPNTEYTLQVRSKCDESKYSDYTTTTFTTLCQLSIPYMEQFNSADIRDNKKPSGCWTLSKAALNHTGFSNITSMPTNEINPGLMIDDWRNVTQSTCGINGKYASYDIGLDDSVSLKILSSKDYKHYFVLPETGSSLTDLTLSFSMRACMRYQQYSNEGSCSGTPVVINLQTDAFARSIKIGTLTNPSDTSTFQLLYTATLPIIPYLANDSAFCANMWQKFTIDLSAASGKYLTFMSDFDKNNIVWIDDIQLQETGTETVPAAIRVSELGETTVKISAMTPEVLSGNYTVNIYDLSNSASLTTSDYTAEAGIITLTDLNEGTDYKVEVVKEGAIGIPSVMFKTQCSMGSSLNENFDDANALYVHRQDNVSGSSIQYGSNLYYLPNCWRYGVDQWQYNSSSPTGSSVDVVNNTSSYTYAKSGSGVLRIVQDRTKGKVWAVMPKLTYDDLAQNISDMQLSFYIRALYCSGTATTPFNNRSTDSYSHSIKIGLLEHPDSIQNVHLVTHYTTATHTNSDNDPDNLFWEKVTIDNFPSDKGEYIVFYSDDETKDNAVWIDNVVLQKKPNCSDPTDITITPTGVIATVTWTMATPSDVQIQLLDNIQQAIGDPITTSETSYTFNQLTPNTTYHVAIKTACEDVEYETFTKSFTTMHGLKYEEDMYSTMSVWSNKQLPAQWNAVRANADSIIAKKSAFQQINTENGWQAYSNGGNYYNSLRLVVSTRQNFKDSLWIISPSIDLTTDASNSVFFTYQRAISGSSSSLTAPTFPDDTTMDNNQFCILLSPDNGQTWEYLKKWKGSASADSSIRNIEKEVTADTVDISSYKNRIIKFAIYTYSDGKLSSDAYRIFFGNFSLFAENKACENVSNIQVSNISPTATNISWTNPDDATNKTELLITTKTLTDLEISTNSASESIFLRDTVENTNTYTISQKLGNNTVYYIYMRHWCDEEDKSSWSDPVSFQSPYMLPYTPFNNFVYETSTFMPDWTRTGDLQYSENTITTAALADAAATSGTWSAQNNAEDNLMDNPYTRIMCGRAGHHWMLSPVIDMTDVATDTTVLLKFKLALSTSSTISDETWESLQDSLILMVKDADAEYWSMTNSIQWYNSTNNDHINPDGTVNPNRYSYSRIGKDTAITYFVDMSAYVGKKIQLAFYIVSKETASYGFNIGDLELDYAQHGSIHTTTLCLPVSDENKLSTQLQTRFGNNYTVCDYANEMYDINVDSLKAGTHTLMIYCPATETSAQHIEAMIATLNQTPEIEFAEAYFEGEIYKNDEFDIDTMIMPESSSNKTMMIFLEATESLPCEGYIYFENVLAPDSIIVDTFVSINKLPYVYTYENKTIVNITSAEIGNIQKDTAWLTIDRVNGKATRLFHTIHFIMNAKVDINETYFVGEHYTNDSLFIDTILTADADNSMYIAVDTTETTPIGGYVKFHNILTPDSIVIDTAISVDSFPYTYVFNGDTLINYTNVNVGDTLRDTIWLIINRDLGTAIRLFVKLVVTDNTENGLPLFEVNATQTRKVLRNGNVFIIKHDKAYNILGIKVKEEE